MAQLAIKGHASRGKEIIGFLRMLGANNTYQLSGDEDYAYYVIERGEIRVGDIIFGNEPYIIFTLEEFIEKYPYKVGDKVRFSDSNTPFTISRIWWDNNASELICTLEEQDIDVSSVDLQPYKEETMEEIIKIDIPKGYEFAGIDDDNRQVIFEKISCQYPKTYVECYEVLGYEPDEDEINCYQMQLIESFVKLLICRDAYWKIAGKEMGMDKPWEPDWIKAIYTCTIISRSNKIIKDSGFDAENRIIAFPTEEMRDAFYENFKDLIEECKEFL